MVTRLSDAGATSLFCGVCSEASAGLIAALAKQNDPDTTIALVNTEARALELATEIETYANWLIPEIRLRVSYFPENPPEDREHTFRTDQISARLNLLSTLLHAKSTQRLLVVATPEAILGICPERSQFEDRRLELVAEETYSFKALVQTLVEEFGYDAEALCEYPGQVATRGGLVDIYPCDASQPYRLDFFGDTLESIRTFDPSSQRSEDTVTALTIPAADTVQSSNQGSDGQFVNYLEDGPVAWIFEEPAQLVREHPLRFEKVNASSGRAGNFEHVFLRRARCADLRLGICSMDTKPKFFDGAHRIELATEPTANYRSYGNLIEPGTDRFETEQASRARFEGVIADWATKQGRAIWFVVKNESEADAIKNRLSENLLLAGLNPQYLYGALGSGFVCDNDPPWLPLKADETSDGIALITGDEYFGRQSRKLHRTRERARPTLSQVDKLLDFNELIDGDPLVHLQHGVCLFRGLCKLEVQSGKKEMISVEFADKITVHVPLNESHLLTRYVGLTKSRPKLDKVGSAIWDKKRKEAEVATLDYAAELLRLHAKRSQHDGYAFPADHPWQTSFEQAFPYTETPDQLSAIKATKADMEAERPMDRLICGDVGFGKTEVAIRAAFKAVLSGKQVAVLAPTTVLCQQHFNTFLERMAQYPIIVDTVSRFRSAKQCKKILAQLVEGRIDIIVGTHRLLSKDVHFQDLGLLIIDEEQRFGVRQKERIKQISMGVDILTLSATPIPRTLYMALAGARAMSVIETPPADRKPIETIVKSYSPDLVKSAIQAETDRGGQVFYLHNRVATIEGVASVIREMHPKLRVAVGHGQMEKDQLEKIMTQFVAREFDVLVCTTIIESGIDIPNCNTLIIDGADRFGLAQLYQIRGRVGRFNRQAYAYLLLHRHTSLVDRAQKRLHTLKQHNQIGAGFRIAMRDLELRGAGNLLGAQQSGHIAGVGFELYCQLLKQSVARLKGEPGADRIRAEVRLDFVATGEGGSRSRNTSGTFSFAAIKESEYRNRSDQLIEAALPAEYIAEPHLRIDLYRRLALASDGTTIREIAEELTDRFGELPEPAKALIEISHIRILAEEAGVRRVETEKERLICRLAQPDKNGEFLKKGTRFPRLSTVKPFKKLQEIQKFLARNRRQ